MNSVNSLYYHARISAPAPTIDLAAATLVYITHLARSLARWLANVRNGGTNGLPGLQASSDDSRYVLYCLPFLSFILHRESFSQHTDGRGRQMRCGETISFHLIPRPCCLYFPVTTTVMFIVISLYCYVHCYRYSSHSTAVLSALVYYYYYYYYWYWWPSSGDIINHILLLVSQCIVLRYKNTSWMWTFE
jgi:hypothetical protein